MPRPVAELVAPAKEGGKPVAHVDAYDWTMRQDAARELIAYLDAHVPDDQNDYGFADSMVEQLFDYLRDDGRIPECLDILADAGFVPTEAPLNHLLALIANFANNLPHWRNNGWTPMEVMNGAADFDDNDYPPFDDEN